MILGIKLITLLSIFIVIDKIKNRVYEKQRLQQK